MKEFFNINSDKWLGGVNVHNTITIALLGYIVYKLR
jgi:hypothetical protein